MLTVSGRVESLSFPAGSNGKWVEIEVRNPGGGTRFFQLDDNLIHGKVVVNSRVVDLWTLTKCLFIPGTVVVCLTLLPADDRVVLRADFTATSGDGHE